MTHDKERREPQPSRPSGPGHVGPGTGEVVISGVDTGPDSDERQNRTPTEEHVRFQAFGHDQPEPDNEDG